LIKAINKQGWLFCAIALLVTLIGRFLPAQLSAAHMLLVLAFFIFFLGVPHGALDPVFAKDILNLRTRQAWIAFFIAYMVLVFAVIFIWWQLPLVFIISFILLSSVHFARDLNGDTPKVVGLLYGGSVIVLPTLLHSEEVRVLFAAILDPSTAQRITGVLQALAGPWLVATLLLVCHELIKNKRLQIELIALNLLSTVADPLVSFTVYFCAMHSVRHVLRAREYTGVPFGRLALISSAPMAGVFLMGVIGWLYSPQLPHDERLLRFIFVGLAALTVPHMVLVDRIKYRH
jgi:beta-carotene 15,15'-dioxygenase